MPLDVEIGCGVGLHPIRYAHSHPDRFLVAIEQTRTKYEKFAGRVANHEGLSNLLPVHADAIEWITHFVLEGSVDRYFFLYPNPNPKPKDENKRWYAMPFMEKVLSTLKPGGTLAIATNEAFYARDAEAFLTRIWGMTLVERREIHQSRMPAGFPRTHFEKKYLERGQICFDLLLRKD